MAKPKKKRDKPWIEKLTEVLDELEEYTDCVALHNAHEMVETAAGYAKEVHDELLELQEMKVDHEALVKQVNGFINGMTRLVDAAEKRKEGRV